MKTIANMVVGSKLHGLSTQHSDVDSRAIYLSSLRSVISPFEHDETPQGDGDFEAYELRKFAKMCAGGNPTALEVLWSNIEREPATAEWLMLQNIRKSFLDSHRVTSAHIGYIDASIRALTKRTEPTKRLRKHYVAGIRIAHQAMQLLTSHDFCVRIEEYDQGLALELMDIKESNFDTDENWCLCAVDELEALKAKVRMTESEIIPFEANTDVISDLLVELYSHQTVPA
jgi:predicted nucleotidyltransferase